MAGIGHNNGPTMEKGRAWRRYAWTRARADLLPKLPLEVARRRVRRARELGIDYASYAGIRAATGRDIVALLFSTNALAALRDLNIPEERDATVQAVRGADLLAMVQPPIDPHTFRERHPVFIRAARAPGIASSWRETGGALADLRGAVPADGVVVIGATHLERDWVAAGRLAGFIKADRYFASR
ncbi:hypothetical protein GQ651_08970 [Alphaproteobacteria bacterium GH1-50]|uniref:Uncharacterized protein n=1 Tax=Kangsaoukella pontilimi TaxID=2691042 RepID=A0A7C9MJR3_9RHOB|nr:hypothetical protein [Kangsaoukella pontilimi]MXQ07975.1 hypothetical protein [Kangsaoukella pontilimi]